MLDPNALLDPNTELQMVLAKHIPVKVHLDRRRSNPAGLPHISDPYVAWKPIWYIYEGRACVFGPKDHEGVRPVIYLERRR